MLIPFLSLRWGMKTGSKTVQFEEKLEYWLRKYTSNIE
jgi:hypothetical protein